MGRAAIRKQGRSCHPIVTIATLILKGGRAEFDLTMRDDSYFDCQLGGQSNYKKGSIA